MLKILSFDKSLSDIDSLLNMKTSHMVYIKQFYNKYKF